MIKDFNKFVDKKLDDISDAGGFFGNLIGKTGLKVFKILGVIIVVVFFGVFVFLWATAQGISKKDEDHKSRNN